MSIESTKSKENDFFVYLLECSDKSTYVGATIDVNHRLRQHNKEIKGGAIATTRKIKGGHKWKRLLHIRGFPDWSSALQFEWAFKFYSRKYIGKYNPMERRIRGLYDIMNLEKPTSKAKPYFEYNNGFDEPDGIPGPKIVWECSEYKSKYESLSL
jgi:predicted GIY-YIG superfamily endonuclease